MIWRLEKRNIESKSIPDASCSPSTICARRLTRVGLVDHGGDENIASLQAGSLPGLSSVTNDLRVELVDHREVVSVCTFDKHL